MQILDIQFEYCNDFSTFWFLFGTKRVVSVNCCMCCCCCCMVVCVSVKSVCVCYIHISHTDTDVYSPYIQIFDYIVCMFLDHVRHHATTHITVSAMQMTLIMLMNAWMLLLLRHWLRLLLLLLLMMLQLLMLLLLQIVVVVHEAGLRTNHLCSRQGEEICKKETPISINNLKYLL